jgi:hypothetical protein
MLDVHPVFAMLVRALRLRHHGVRLTADELRAVEPLVGRLQYEANPTGGRDDRGALTCLLMPLGNSVEPQLQLFHARVRRIDRRGLVIQGTEDHWVRMKRESYRQALWAWPINLAELEPSTPHPIDAEEEAKQTPRILR